MAARRRTLQQLYRIARRDRRFFDALLKNPRTALAKKEISLSPADLRKLEKALRKVYKISARDLTAILITGKVTVRPWPTTFLRPWPGLTDGRWP
jgi:hypothetical protein